MAEMVSPYNRALELPWTMGGWSFDTLPGLAKVAGEINRQAAMLGYMNAFMMYTAACLVAMPLVLLVRRAK